MAENDKAFAFDPFDQFTIVVTTPVGTSVTYAKYSELETLDVVEPGDGITVEVIPPARPDGTTREGVALAEGESVKDVADRFAGRGAEAAAEPVAEARHVAEKNVPAARTATATTGPVGPDPKQEAARSVAVDKPAAKAPAKAEAAPKKRG